MNRLLKAAHEFALFCSDRGFTTCVIGGVAIQRWGEPRTTLDADFTVLTGWGDEATVVDAVLAHFESRIPDARAFALEHRVLLVSASNGVDLDIALGALPFEHEMMERASVFNFGDGALLPCCSAEDLFIMKAFAGRPRDWADAESIVARIRALDQDYVLRHLADLCELAESPDCLTRATRLLKERQ